MPSPTSAGAVAARKGIALPTEPTPQHRAVYDQLAARAGWDFDRAYMSEMVRDHDQDVSAFERAVQGRLPLIRIGWAVLRPQGQAPAPTAASEPKP